MTRKFPFIILFICSLVFNVAITGTWLIHTIQDHYLNKNKCMTFKTTFSSCPLHQTLQLTGKQWDSIKPGINVFRMSVKELCGKIVITRTALVDELEKPQPDTSVLNDLRNKILANQQELQKLSIQHILSQKAHLTPGQKRHLFSVIRKNMGCDVKPGGFESGQ